MKRNLILLIVLIPLFFPGCDDDLDRSAGPHTVTYNANGAAGGTVPVDGNEYAAGQSVIVLGNTGNLVKTDSLFSGWNTVPDGSGFDYGEGSTFSEGRTNIILYAQWGSSTGLVYTKRGSSYSVAGNGLNAGTVRIAPVYMGCSVTVIADDAFYNCSGITGVTMPEDLRSIGNNAFHGCSGLTGRLTIPVSVTSIGSSAFQGCSGITGVDIPASVTSIGNGAFSSCSAMSQIIMKCVLPPVLSSGSTAFDGIASGAQIEVPDASSLAAYENAVGWSAYSSLMISSCAVMVYTAIGTTSYSVSGNGSDSDVIIIPSTYKGLPVTDIGKNGFSCCKVTNVTIPSSVTSIGADAFWGCSAMTDITIPSSVTSIGYGAFSGCESLKQITIPGTVTALGDDICYSCSGLTSVVIQNGVTSISSSGFLGCSSLAAITIPASVTSVGESAFWGCSSLADIYMCNPVPVTVNWTVFKSIASGARFHVPASAVAAYTGAGWGAYGSIVTP